MSKTSKTPHISRSGKAKNSNEIRHIKHESRTFFRRPEPFSLMREMEHEHSGEFHYKQALPEKKAKRG